MLHQFKPTHTIHTIVIGAGPTGLAASYLLKEQNIPHILLEQTQLVASSWHRLWNNYKLAMPAKKVEMPGVNLGDYIRQDQHPSRDEMIAFFEWYAAYHALPICFKSSVLSIRKSFGNKFIVDTNSATYFCDKVICCIGPRQNPKYPIDEAKIAKVTQTQLMHSSDYQSCANFDPAKKVLVVGSGASALSIAYDVLNQGYMVELACAFSQEHILAANQHLYESSDETIVPTLGFLEEAGILNRGRLIDIVDNTLIFEKESEIAKMVCKDYGVIICATGYQPSFQLLNHLFRYVDLSLTPKSDCIGEIPGLYIAGIPKENEQTVIISHGTEQAKKIVADIMKCQATQTVANHRKFVAKY
ncbi:NAD(P)-binding domain-containing protein [Candidatus Berkiella aquae]|uniref:NAD(P)-binding domain-containing protein n=1 Tax=Candidatus Berkiella aquae TaxID=295108 RepID=A0A0Q9YIH1_9GAMM|nr:NAD(P)-binding domain-containing protein [Candidatus Berkiella aquae]MCS5712216.1 NAD(P)-binding domain-containing protein [Candidatus Berkiella aquae]